MPFAVLFQDEPKSVALLLSIGVFVWAAIHGGDGAKGVSNLQTGIWHLWQKEDRLIDLWHRHFCFRYVNVTINGL